MAKKKSDPPDLPPRQAAVTVKGTEAYKGWVERLAEFCRTNVSGLTDMALAKFARDQGFKEEPPPR